MKVLIACEYSQTICEAFIESGHEAMSCDFLAGEKGLPHYQGSCFDILNDSWDLIIAHPPCTETSAACAYRWKDREKELSEAVQFVQAIWNAPAKMICIENPAGYLSKNWLQPSQIINPFNFGEPWKKRTCLWLRNLPPLIYTCHNPFNKSFVSQFGSNVDRRKERSRFFPLVAQAMANQWGTLSLN